MMQAKEICRMAGITRRTLHFYSERGIVRPTGRTESGYGLYSDEDLMRLFCIRFYAAMGFSLEKAVEFYETDAKPTREELAIEIERIEAEIEQKKKILAFLKLEKTMGFYVVPEVEPGESFEEWLDRALSYNMNLLKTIEVVAEKDEAKPLNDRLIKSLSSIASMRRKGYEADSQEVLELVKKSVKIAESLGKLFVKEEETQSDMGLRALSLLGIAVTDRDSDIGRIFKPEAATYIHEAIDHYCVLNNAGYILNDNEELISREEPGA